MSQDAEIKERIARLQQDARGLQWEVMDGRVTNVDEAGQTVDVEIEEGVELYDVKLRALADGGKSGLMLLPKKGSEIVFAAVRGSADYVLLAATELDKVLVEIDSVKMEVSKNGYSIKKGSVSLLDLFSDLAGLLEQFKVTTPSGPSVSVMPDTMTAIAQLKTKFKDLLK